MHPVSPTLASTRSKRWLVLALIAAVWALIGANDASASHFRYGHINWQPAAAPANAIDFSFQAAWRRDYPFPGGCRNTFTGGSQACTGGPLPNVGDVVNEPLGALNTGAGPVITESGQGLWYRVTSVDVTNNWIFTVAIDPASVPGPGLDTLITHSYAGPGPPNVLAFIDNAARLDAFAPPNRHVNNPVGGWRIETRVNPGATANRSPVSGMPPIVQCPINGTCAFQVPGVDPDGDGLFYRLSTPTEASSQAPASACGFTFCQPGPPFSTNPATISSTGLYTWNTAGAQLAPPGPQQHALLDAGHDRGTRQLQRHQGQGRRRLPDPARAISRQPAGVRPAADADLRLDGQRCRRVVDDVHSSGVRSRHGRRGHAERGRSSARGDDDAAAAHSGEPREQRLQLDAGSSWDLRRHVHGYRSNASAGALLDHAGRHRRQRRRRRSGRRGQLSERLEPRSGGHRRRWSG